MSDPNYLVPRLRDRLGLAADASFSDILTTVDTRVAAARSERSLKQARAVRAARRAASVVSAEDALYAAAFGKPAGPPAPLNAEDRLYEQAFGSSKVGA